MNLPSIVLPQRRLLAGVAIGVLVGVIGVGAVTAASPTPSGSSAATAATGATGATGTTGGTGAGSSNAGAAAKAGVRLGALRQAIRGDFRVTVGATNKNGTHNILYVRGTLALAANSVTVTLPDNSTQTFTVDSTTVVREQGQKISFSDLTAGERAMVFGTKNDDGSYTAKLIRCVKEPKTNPASPTASPTT